MQCTPVLLKRLQLLGDPTSGKPLDHGASAQVDTLAREEDSDNG